MDYWKLSAVELADGIRKRHYSCTDVMASVTARIRARNPELNAITVDCSADALIEAEHADAAIRRGEVLGELHGVPVTIKENVDQEGQATTNGLAAFANVIAPADAPVVRNLRNDVFDRILHQPLRFFDRHPTGELMSRISADIERVQSAASDTLAEALKQGATAVAMVGTILYIDWKLSLASFVLLPLVLYPTAWFGKRLRSLSRSNQQEMADMSGVIYEAFSGNRIVKARQELRQGRLAPA